MLCKGYADDITVMNAMRKLCFIFIFDRFKAFSIPPFDSQSFTRRKALTKRHFYQKLFYVNFIKILPQSVLNLTRRHRSQCLYRRRDAAGESFCAFLRIL